MLDPASIELQWGLLHFAFICGLATHVATLADDLGEDIVG